MPSQVYCNNILGSRTMFGPWTGNYSAYCTGQAVSSGQVPQDQVMQAVCGTCTPFYNISSCFADGTRHVTTYPNLQSLTCAAGDSSALCSRFINFSSGTPVSIPCDYTPASSPAGIFLICSLMIAAAVIFILMSFVAQNRESKVIQYAQYYPTLVCCGGGALMALCGICFVGPNTAATCQLRTWLFNLTVTIFFTPLFLKVYRVWLIFENPKLSRVVISNRRMATWMVSILMVEIVWLIIWTAVSPTQPKCSFATFPGLANPVPVTFCGLFSFFLLFCKAHFSYDVHC